ncbi:MAG: tRNA (uridine(34)/cytosine(34)/5-carboxymethylaminomethyluridine(34)-2'-O)-methyltransferase TrmL [Pseudomonadales bacterium]|nr:tRNA (uridine(34)/cytosine(34)/5-carboxymethylaminomethyluridine(34)-2'-O)-methyltransferase TrmL [Pseudomonadales bacterium]
MPFSIVLYEPEIPPNTGNIIRLCANTGASLHLIRPFGFEWEDRRLKRAGLDYHDLAHVTLHDSYDEYVAQVQPPRSFAFTTKATNNYTTANFSVTDAFVFGPETRGLPADFLAALPKENRLRIPMHPESRSLNLANSVAVALYEAWRQVGFVDSR